jgi:hypothetical protein
MQTVNKEFRALKARILPHLMKQEEKLNEKLLDTLFPQTEQVTMTAQLLRERKDIELFRTDLFSVQKGRQPKYQLPLLLYSLTSEEKKLVKKEMSWMTTKVVLPMFWKKSSRKLVSFFFNPSKHKY